MKTLLLIKKIVVSVIVLFGVNAFAKTLVFALKPDKDPSAMESDRVALEQALSGLTEKEVSVIVPLSGTAILTGLRNGTIDAAFLSGADLVRLENQSIGKLQLAVQINGQFSYQSMLVAHRESPINQLSDLRGQSISFASRTSTSGFIVPIFELANQGWIRGLAEMDMYFGKNNVHFATGYVAALDRVAKKLSQAAFVSDYVMNGDRHLTPEQKTQFKIVAKFGQVPTHGIAFRKDLPESHHKKLLGALLTMPGKYGNLSTDVFGGPLRERNGNSHLAELKKAMTLAAVL